MARYIHLIRTLFLIIVVSTVVIVNEAWMQRPNTWSTKGRFTSSLWDSRLVDLSTNSVGHMVYLTWEDNREGIEEVYFKRSLDDGVTWGSDVRLSRLTPQTPEPEPRLAASSGQVMVVFANRTASGEHLFYTVSYDWGIDFSPPIQLTTDSGDQSNGVVAFVASTVHLVWQQYLDGEVHIFYANSLDSGRTWKREVPLTNATASQDQYPAIMAVGNKVFVTWSRVQSGAEAIYVKASLDAGDTWQPEVQVSDFVGGVYPEFPAITSNGSQVDLVWGSSGGIQYSRSSDLGETWSAPVPLTDAFRQYVAPRIVAAMYQIQVVTTGLTNFGSDVYYLTSADGGQTWNAAMQLTTHREPAFSLAPVIASNRDGTFVAWEDNSNGHYVITFRSRPDFLLLQDYERQLVSTVVLLLIATTGVYLEIESRTSRQESYTRTRGKPSRRDRVRSGMKGSQPRR